MSDESAPVGNTPDPLERDKFEYDKERQRLADEEARANKGRLAQKRAGAITSAQGSARNYFTQQGLNPDDYAGDINDAITEAMGSIGEDDPNPSSYLSGIGNKVYGQETDKTRNKANSSLDALFTPDYADRRISDTTDDDVIASILAEQRGTAEDQVNNMVSRGVINTSGKAAADKELDRQGAGARANLNSLGTGALAAGRQSITDLINKARTTAGSLKAGGTLDTGYYSHSIDDAFNSFLGGLGDNIRGKVTSPLFDTSQLASIAGGGQGAQNFKYDPKALRGVIKPPDDPNNPSPSIFGGGGGAIF